MLCSFEREKEKHISDFIKSKISAYLRFEQSFFFVKEMPVN